MRHQACLLGDPWKKNKSSPQSEKSPILHSCNSTWRRICCKGLKQRRTSPASSISNLLFSNRQNVRWHQVSLKWDFSSPALTASHLPSLPWRTCGTDQLRWSLEGHRLAYSLCPWNVRTYTQWPPCFAENMIFYLKNMSAPTTTWEVAMCSGEARNKTTAVFWSNILVTETLHNWVLSFLGQRRGEISKVCTFTDKGGELVHQSLPESLSLAPKSDLRQPQHPGLAECHHSSQEDWASCLYREGNTKKNLGTYIS